MSAFSSIDLFFNELMARCRDPAASLPSPRKSVLIFQESIVGYS